MIEQIDNSAIWDGNIITTRDINLPCLFSALGAMAVVRRCRGDCRSVECRIFGVHSLNGKKPYGYATVWVT